MSTFIQELWESIFVPGPTPTLLKAANAAFATLQVLLLILLAATYSIHFVILSVLCGGLWWSINWFAMELKAQQQREEEEKLAQGDRAAQGGTDDSDTEVEGTAAESGPEHGAVSKSIQPVEQGELKHRTGPGSVAGTQSSVSTEDEWEKVSENENEKDK